MKGSQIEGRCIYIEGLQILVSYIDVLSLRVSEIFILNFFKNILKNNLKKFNFLITNRIFTFNKNLSIVRSTFYSFALFSCMKKV